LISAINNLRINILLFYSFPVLSAVQFLAHTVFDVVVDDEIQLFVGETVVLGKKTVNLVDDGLGKFWIVFVINYFAGCFIVRFLPIFVRFKALIKLLI